MMIDDLYTIKMLLEKLCDDIIHPQNVIMCTVQKKCNLGFCACNKTNTSEVK